MANFIRNVLVDGVKYAVGDKRIEGDNFAYIQVPEAITVGTNLTDLAPIQKALDSTDGAMLYVPSLNALFSPTASTSPTVRIWSSTVGDKGYQLKATLNASGVLQSAVINEAPAADSGLVISYADFDQLRTEAADDDNWDDTHTYLITDKAKEVAGKLINIESGLYAVDQFQLESGINPLYGIHAPLSYFYSVLETKQIYSQSIFIVRFTSSGIIEDVNMATGDLIEKKCDICPVYEDDILGIIIEEPEAISPFNIGLADYITIKSNTSHLATPDSYDESALAKSIGQALKDRFYNYNDNEDIYEWDIDHFTVSEEDTTPTNADAPHALSFYTLSNIDRLADGTDYLKFTTTAEINNGDIFVYHDGTDCLGMRIDPKPEDCVKVAKKYMEVEVDPAPIQVMQKEITVSDGDTLNINSVLISIDVPDKEIIHYPSSVILKGDDEFALEFKIGWNTTWTSGWYGTNYDGSTTYLEYSYDGKTWVNIPKEVAMTPIQSKYNDELNGHVIFIRGNSSMYTKDMDICKAFITSTDATYVDILGDIAGICPEPGYNALQQFFANNALIRDCSGLKMHTNLGYDSGAYIQMFLGCVNLIKPPILPATELCASAYDQMFGGCTSLTSAPVLPATILGAACYGQMFKECTALVNAPVLIAKNIPQNAYTNMFEGCTALVIPPVILAESVDSNGCYEMFKDCTSLKRCPDLNFTTLSGEYCCAYMFGGCTLLTRPANLYPTTIVKGAYNYMYDGCTNIKWATTGEPYRIPCIGEGTATVPSNYADFMFSADDPSDPLPEGTGTPKLNTTYYLAV